jgi:hypothetical protein
MKKNMMKIDGYAVCKTVEKHKLLEPVEFLTLFSGTPKPPNRYDK